MIKFEVRENDANQRLDRFLKKLFRKAPLSMIYKMIRKDIKINGRRGKEDTMLAPGDELVFYMSEEKFEELSEAVIKKPVRKQFKTVYEDDNILIVSKPRGLIIHGDAHEKKNTLVNQVTGYLQEKGDYDPAAEKTFAPAPVNRLDRNTTGLVIFGKNAMALRLLTRLIRERNCIGKYYMTVVSGRFDKPMVFGERLVKDSSTNTVGVADGEDGKEALTYVDPVLPGMNYSIVRIKLVTGRTHQIRVHLSHAGFPLLGDPKYGTGISSSRAAELGITTQLLHAYRLEFNNMPDELAYLEGRSIEAPLPSEFERIRKLIRAEERQNRKDRRNYAETE
ncbi:MAG: RluA family pseudouridine synthase [Lentihominibacter sp.]